MPGRIITPIKPNTAVDLADPTVFADLRHRRELHDQIAKLELRASWLTRRAGRLRVDSNGRRKTLAQVDQIRAQIVSLQAQAR